MSNNPVLGSWYNFPSNVFLFYQLSQHIGPVTLELHSLQDWEQRSLASLQASSQSRGRGAVVGSKGHPVLSGWGDECAYPRSTQKISASGVFKAGIQIWTQQRGACTWKQVRHPIILSPGWLTGTWTTGSSCERWDSDGIRCWNAYRLEQGDHYKCEVLLATEA